MNESIIVYRSQFEKNADEFWINFFSEHYEIMMWVFGAFFLFVIGFILYVFIRIMFPKRMFGHRNNLHRFK